MYLMVFKQGQTAFTALLEAIGGMYEDNLYLTDLYTFLDRPARNATGVAVVGPKPGDGIRFEAVTFAYPGANTPALRDLSLHIRPGQKMALVGENGSGKTTFIKLLTRLYRPTSGRILLDGLDLAAWDETTLRRRMGVIFQDFVRYQFGVGENIGAGDEARFEDRAGWSDAAHKALANDFIEALPKGYETRLGRWFDDGRELSGGQWQKIALARAFMRARQEDTVEAGAGADRGADIVVLDEPTSAIDAEAEAAIFARFRSATQNQMAILISHRFSTVRQADAIAVLHGGQLIEQGSHESLMALGGRYAYLFNLQARAYVEDPRIQRPDTANAEVLPRETAG
jgi:ATP-binding cassette subfamily B protein